MTLYDFIKSQFNINLEDSKVTLNNCKNDFDPILNAMRMQNNTLSDMEYSNTIAWVGKRNAQLFKVGSYIIQLIQIDRRVRERFMLASIAKVVSCVENPNFVEDMDIKYVAGQPTDHVERSVVVPYEDGGNVPTTRYTYKLERIDLGAFFGLPILVQFKRSEAYQLVFEKFKDSIILEPMCNSSIYKFPGFKNINHSFKEMVNLIDLPEWRSALEHQKGIYLLIDTANGKKYVGSAYGEHSLWQRWKCYLTTGHGGDKGLIPLGKDYIMDNFKMIVLERCADDLSNTEIIQHESFWKEKLMTREFGYNEN